MNAQGGAAKCRCHGEYCYANYEYQTAPEQVPERTSDQNERAQKQAIRLDHPLHIDNGCVKVDLDSGQGDVDDRAIDESHARAENRRDQYPDSVLWVTGGCGTG